MVKNKMNLKWKLGILLLLIIAGVYFSVANQRSTPPVLTEPVGIADDTDEADRTLRELGFGSQPKATPPVKAGSVSGSTSEPEAAPYLLSATAKSVLLECAKESETFRSVSDSNHFDTLDEYLAQAVSHHEKPAIELQFRNLHALNQLGEKRRLHVASSFGEGSNQQQMEVQLFGVDKDSLPIPLDLPGDYETLSWSQKIDKFQSETHGSTLDEAQNSYRWRSGASAQVTERNGRIEELQIYLENHGSLGCSFREGREINCECRP